MFIVHANSKSDYIQHQLVGQVDTLNVNSLILNLIACCNIFKDSDEFILTSQKGKYSLDQRY